MLICRLGVESEISACLTSSQVFPAQLVHRVARVASGFLRKNTTGRDSAAFGRQTAGLRRAGGGGVSEVSLGRRMWTRGWTGCGVAVMSLPEGNQCA